MLVSPDPARILPSSPVALSRVRTLVVPTAHTRPPAARRSLTNSATSGETEYHRMHDVLVGIFDLDRLERPGSDVQQDFGSCHAARGEPVEKLRGEVQPRSWGGDRSRFASEHRLISLGVARRVGALDVGRKRHMPEPLDGVVDRNVAYEPDDPRSPLCNLKNLNRKARRDVDASTRFEFAAGRYHRLVLAWTDGLEQQNLGGRARGSAPKQSRTKDPRPVDDEDVPRLDELDELDDVGKRAVGNGACRQIDDHEPTRVAPLERFLRDLIRGKLKVVV